MPAVQLCPGPCNSGYRRVKAEFETAVKRHAALIQILPEGKEPPRAPVMPPDPKPWWGSPVWCGKCSSRIRQCLAELDDLAALRITQHPASQRGQRDDGAGRVSGSRAPASPSPAVDDLDEMAGHLRDWESAARGEDERAPRRGHLASQLTTVVAWLTSHLDQLLIAEFAEDFGFDVLRWHRELEGKVKAGTGMKHRKKPCPRCHLYSLWERAGDDYIMCVSDDCGRRLTREEFDGLPDAA